MRGRIADGCGELLIERKSWERQLEKRLGFIVTVL